MFWLQKYTKKGLFSQPDHFTTVMLTTSYKDSIIKILLSDFKN